MRKLCGNVMIGFAVALASFAVAAQPPSSAPAATTAPAAAVVDSATVPVADTSEAARKTAFGTALVQVLNTRLGRRLTADTASGLAAQAATWVQQYQYMQAPAGGPGYDLRVRFVDSALDQLVHRLDTPAVAATIPGQLPGAAAHATQALVSVAGIGSAQAFANALGALRALPGMQRVVVRAAGGGSVLLDVTAAVPVEQVLARLGGSGLLPAAARLGAALGLRWQG